MTHCNLILSGGGARAYAHIGVIKALHERNITFDAISATSAGSVVGAFLCDGFSLEEIIDLFSRKLSLINFNYSLKNGFLSHANLAVVLQKNLRSTHFETLKYPLFISATNLNDGAQRIFNSGNIIDAVIASASIPILYKPVIIDDIPYVDGGISSNLPVEPFYNSDLKTIGVHVNPIDKFDLSQKMKFQMERLLHLCILDNMAKNAKKVDLFIEPPQLKQFSLFDLKNMNNIIRVGYDYAVDQLNGSSLFDN